MTERGIHMLTRGQWTIRFPILSYETWSHHPPRFRDFIGACVQCNISLRKMQAKLLVRIFCLSSDSCISPLSPLRNCGQFASNLPQKLLDKPREIRYNIICAFVRCAGDMVDIAQVVRVPGCGPGGRRFESDYPPHLKPGVRKQAVCPLS